MNCRMLNHLLRLTLVALFLVACGPPATAPTATLAPPTEAPTPNPGIDTPLTIESIQLQLSSATEQDTYTVGIQTFEPNSPEDTCLIVEATISTGDPNDVQGWEVSITDENGRKNTSSMTSIKSMASGQGDTIMWLFVVAKASHSFTLHLPGEQTVKLDSLLDTSSASAPVPADKPTLPSTTLVPEPTLSPTPEVIALPLAIPSVSIPYCKDAQEQGLISGDTYLCMSSEEGDLLGDGKTWILTPEDGDFSAEVVYGYDQVDVTIDSDKPWRLHFAPPDDGQAWVTGVYYEDGKCTSSPDHPVIFVQGDERGCDCGKSTGRFEILELEYGTSYPREVKRFAANFEFHCYGTEPTLWGSIRLNSTVEP